MTRYPLWRPVAAALLLIAALAALRTPTGNAAQQASTPTAYSCDTATPPAGTPAAGMSGMDMGSPMAEMDMDIEFDQLYIDMMIPHHLSIVALSEAALPRLTDERLRTIAEAIIAAQTTEVAELRGYRERFYGCPEPMPMDADVAFIDLVIPHHEMAVAASEAALGQATHEEIRVFAARVIDAQQREIDELITIRSELTGVATPVASAGGSHTTAHTNTSTGDPASTTGSADEAELRVLTAEQIAQIERGEGAGFALPAELNGIPGPRHVLDLAVELDLSSEQVDQAQRIFDAMRADAIPAGETYLDAQRALEQAFRDGTLTESALPGRVAEVSRLQGELASIHLVAHLRTAALLTADQIATYRQVRQTT